MNQDHAQCHKKLKTSGLEKKLPAFETKKTPNMCMEYSGLILTPYVKIQNMNDLTKPINKTKERKKITNN